MNDSTAIYYGSIKITSGFTRIVWGAGDGGGEEQAGSD